jgi:N-acetylglutamate synthase-like GNAT family acetyltransferase
VIPEIDIRRAASLMLKRYRERALEDRDIGVITRMCVHEKLGVGAGLRILQELEARARAFGLSTLRLETNQILKEAEALYRRCGYR